MLGLYFNFYYYFQEHQVCVQKYIIPFSFFFLIILSETKPLCTQINGVSLNFYSILALYKAISILHVIISFGKTLPSLHQECGVVLDTVGLKHYNTLSKIRI